MKPKNAGKPGMHTRMIGISIRPDGAILMTKNVNKTKTAVNKEMRAIKKAHFAQGGK